VKPKTETREYGDYLLRIEKREYYTKYTVASTKHTLLNFIIWENGRREAA
jgi:hypothetical protein